MLVRLKGGVVYDPVNGEDGKKRDIFIRDGVIVSDQGGAAVDQDYNVKDKVIMAGGIDMHSHIAGGKLNIARYMMPDRHRESIYEKEKIRRSGSGVATMSSFATGYRYAEMGFTAAFEPAMMPVNARQCHLEMDDIPIIDKGAYIMIGNDDYSMRLMASKAPPSALSDFVAWTVTATRALGVKLVNPGGVSAFKFNQRSLDVDHKHQHYQVTPREVLVKVSQAVQDVGLPHPLHVHGCNLGAPGSAESLLKLMAAGDGLPMHFTHIQFHAYGDEGDEGFSSQAGRIAEAVNASKSMSVDVGQVLFGETATVSGDVMHQYHSRRYAHQGKWLCMEIDCQGGCGVVPFRYRNRSFVNALQWAIGLELFLLIKDPWRVMLTTDHPNGAPFIMYPHLIRLLMDRSFRNDMLKTIHPGAAAMSSLASINREYSLYEIAVISRAAPARLLGLKRHGHLGAGASGDVVVYTPHGNREKMFSRPDYVFKDGELVVRGGKIVKTPRGRIHAFSTEYDQSALKPIASHYDDYQCMNMEHAMIRDTDLMRDGEDAFTFHPCRRGSN